MKKLIIITAILITGFISSTKSETKIINNPGFEYGFFYTNLAPYGTWMEINDGLVVWRPTDIQEGWAPYRDGRWIWTGDGWYWDSYEPFGYIVFHYGRWYYDDYYGWLWVPDNEWAPAWVDWRYDSDYIGWAPLPPYAVFTINIGVHYTNDYYVPYNNWHFVKYRYFCDPYVYKYYAAPKYRHNIYNRTKYRNNYGYRDGRVVNNGVDINYVRERTGQNIKQHDIVGVSDYKEVEKYRGKDNEAIRTFMPSRDELTRTNVKNVKIEKQNRRASIDVSKIRIGNDNKGIRERNNDVVKQREAPKNIPDIRKENKTDVRTNTQIEKKKENIIVPEKKIERKEVKKVDVNINRSTNEIRKPEIKKENINNNKPIVVPKRNETKPEVRKNNDSNRKPAPNRVEKNNNSDNTKDRRRK